MESTVSTASLPEVTLYAEEAKAALYRQMRLLEGVTETLAKRGRSNPGEKSLAELRETVKQVTEIAGMLHYLQTGKAPCDADISEDDLILD